MSAHKKISLKSFVYCKHFNFGEKANDTFFSLSNTQTNTTFLEFLIRQQLKLCGRKK